MTTYSSYCVACREMRSFEAVEVLLKNGRRAAQGSCPTCGITLQKILPEP